jgi:hypothetical protein
MIARHFVDRYYGLLLLPSCHPQYYHGWINEIQELMVEHECLRYSVLACAASHLHFVDSSPQMQELSLTYYSQAIKGLSGVLAKIGQLENHNGLLMSIMLLYLHGVGPVRLFSDYILEILTLLFHHSVWGEVPILIFHGTLMPPSAS